MKIRSLVLILAALVLVLGVAQAGAKKKPFKPALGTYSGTMTNSVGSTPVTGSVTKAGGKIVVAVVGLGGTMPCSDGRTLIGSVALQPQVKGKAFSETQSGTDAITQGTSTYTISGTFKTPTSFSGTAVKEISGSVSCTTGKIAFALKKKG